MEECPYCGCDIANYNGGYGMVIDFGMRLGLGILYEYTCSKCGKTVNYEIDYMYKKEN